MKMLTITLAVLLAGFADRAVAQVETRTGVGTAKRQQQARVMKRQIELRLGDMDRICELSDAQKKRLRIAAKGAVEHAMRRWEKSFLPRAIQDADDVAAAKNVAVRIAEALRAGEATGVRIAEALRSDAAEFRIAKLKTALAMVDDDDPNDGDVPELKLPDGFVPLQRIPLDAELVRKMTLDSMVAAYGGNAIAVYDETVWKNAVANTLKPEQLKQYQRALRERLKFRRQAIVREYVARVDDLVLLSPKQRGQLVSFFEQQSGPLIDRLPLPAIVQMRHQLDIVYFNMLLASGRNLNGQMASEKKLKEVLTDSQFQRFINNDYGMPAARVRWNAEHPR